MAYSTNPYLPKARATALKLLLLEQLPLATVANRTGVHRSTIWRWKRKWDKLNEHRRFTNDGRVSRPAGVANRVVPAKWQIYTDSSRPHGHPKAIAAAVVQQVLAVRVELGRCAEVVWHHLTTVLGVRISLSSVKRIFRRNHVYDRVGPHGKRRPRPYHQSVPRPIADAPGSLVQTDTIHLVAPGTTRRIYVYTVIDLYTRMAYATVAPRILPGIAAQAVLAAQDTCGFSFAMVQSDNGPEFSKYFEQRLRGAGIQTRHTRLHRLNDNAHIERFNRTIQEECTGSYWNTAVPLARLQEKITSYLDYYNQKRIHLGLQLRTPAGMLQR